MSGFADGPTNMAVDEEILHAVADGSSPPTLRFFGWEPPCLSLGYAQPASDVDRSRLAELGWSLVRRPTGGRAILHSDELTYSVIAPVAEPRVEGGVVESYRRLSAGLLAGLRALNVPAEAQADPPRPEGMSATEWAAVCFEVPSHYEITAGGKKLLGSAQVRKRGVVLQHGSLPLAGDIARICDALIFATEAERERAKVRVRARAATVNEIAGSQPANPDRREIAWIDAAQAMARGFAEALNLELVEGGLTRPEVERAEELRRERYGREEWNLKL
ncbi:MAG: lipoate--protein ligase family protein [Chloroflexi bacterium]|nr:lipoate--protein ligase family protein [Chloroflexota bacterium]